MSPTNAVRPAYQTAVFTVASRTIDSSHKTATAATARDRSNTASAAKGDESAVDNLELAARARRIELALAEALIEAANQP